MSNKVKFIIIPLLILLGLFFISRMGVVEEERSYKTESGVINIYGEPDKILGGLKDSPIYEDSKTGYEYNKRLIYYLPDSKDKDNPDKRIVFLINNKVTGIAIVYNNGIFTKEYSSENQGVISKSSLTITQKQEICRDMKAWMDFCYEQNIDVNTCAEQMNEKVMRLYEVSSSQLTEIYDYCKEIQ